MKKKNEIEQELDQKEFENELHRDLSGEYERLDVEEHLYKDKNKYAISAMNFFSTLIFFEVLYWLVKMIINIFTVGFTLTFFEKLTPFVHLAILILSINAVIKRKSAVDILIDKWPFKRF